MSESTTDPTTLAHAFVSSLLDGKPPNGIQPDQLGPFAELGTEMLRGWHQAGTEGTRRVFVSYADRDPAVAALRADDTLQTLQGLLQETRVPPPEANTVMDDRELLTQGAHDEGNAQRLLRRYEGRFVYNDAWGWMCRSRTHWTTEGAEAVLDRATVDTLSATIEAALKSGKADQYKELISRSIPTSSRVQGAKYLFASLVYTSPSTFDQDPDLLNCPNGVVDLRTGELRHHSPNDRFTHCTAVDYRPGADPSPWVNWLTEAVGGKQVVDWLQMAVGYSFTGHTREEVLFYLYGPSRSGKGTFVETLLDLLRTPLADVDTCDTLPPPRQADPQNFNLAPFHSARLIGASESTSHERFNEAKLKQLTGGDKIQAAFKHKTPFSYRPKHKIWLASNQPVNADPDDDAVWGRLRVIAFPHSHLGSENKSLKEQMRTPAVLEGVLAWAVQGAMRWYKLGSKGLPELENSAKLKQQQRETLDAIGMWIDESCLKDDSYFAASSQLYRNYSDWCKDNGVTAKMQRGFSESLKRKGYRDTRQRINSKLVRGFYGLKID